MTNPNCGKFCLKIKWGVGGSVESEYIFKTEAEVVAFLLGVDESSGWLDYEIVEGAEYDEPDEPDEPDESYASEEKALSRAYAIDYST
jgi:hypothetical protein